MSARALNHWGWGWADRFPDRPTRELLGAQLGAVLGFTPGELADPVALADADVAPSMLAPPALLADIITDARDARARRTYGRSYRDLVRGFRGDFASAPDLVATPRDEADVVALLDWASGANVAVIPFGGGTSVVGGVERSDRERPVLVLELANLDAVLEVERTSLSARIQAGIFGPALETTLGQHGLTLRHFPQSFEFSTLGGWIATRAGGHFATLYTHIDDLVQTTRTVTPRGVLETRRFPSSGAGPSADRLMLGSEGTLGVITEAWMRVRPRPRFRATASVHFAKFRDAVSAVHALSQSGLYPTNCRLLDPREAALNFVATDGSSVVVVGFESADHGLAVWIERALELCRDHGGVCAKGAVIREGGERTGDDGVAGSWKQAFFEAPYLQSTMVSIGVIADTFETACTWDHFEELHQAITHDVRDALRRVAGKGSLSCRFTHVYPDGPAPYYTFLAPAKRGGELAQWAEIKSAASEALARAGGTITHHHGVGRTHRPWYEREAPALFLGMLRAAKREVDPAGIMNPGCLLT